MRYKLNRDQDLFDEAGEFAWAIRRLDDEITVIRDNPKNGSLSMWVFAPLDLDPDFIEESIRSGMSMQDDIYYDDAGGEHQWEVVIRS